MFTRSLASRNGVAVVVRPASPKQSASSVVVVRGTENTGGYIFFVCGVLSARYTGRAPAGDDATHNPALILRTFLIRRATHRMAFTKIGEIMAM